MSLYMCASICSVGTSLIAFGYARAGQKGESNDRCWCYYGGATPPFPDATWRYATDPGDIKFLQEHGLTGIQVFRELYTNPNLGEIETEAPRHNC